MESVKEKVVEAIFPAFCVSCKKTSNQKQSPWLCRKCQRNLRPRLWTFCHFCDKKKGLKSTKSCAHAQTSLSCVTTIFSYEDKPPRRLIHALKYYFVLEVVNIFSEAILKEKTNLKRIEADIIIPIPLHKRKLRERGFNQAELIAQILKLHVGAPLSHDVLEKNQHTSAQMKIKSSTARQKNIRGSFVVKNTKAIAGKHILLVDDVVTTGSTLEEAARALKKAGALSVRAFVLARD